MVYAKTDWKDHVVDATNGAIIQQGTPVSASNLNKMETGIADAHAQLEGAGRATQTLQHGLSVLNGNNNAPVDIQIEGSTLVSMGSTPLDPLKNYVLADKKTKLKFANNTYQGVGKFNGENGKPQITRIANFEGKVSGSTLENPHSAKRTNAGPPFTNSLTLPSATLTDFSSSQISTLDGSVSAVSANNSGAISQHLFSFDLIAEVERNIGRIPRPDIAGKVQWLKDNIKSFTANWHGYGSGPAGNKAYLSVRSIIGNTWILINNNATSGVSKISGGSLNVAATVGPSIENDGFVHFLAYADPSDGVTPSTIITDYAELEIQLKQDAVLHDPCIPLYEVDATDYAKILVEWSESEVLSRYPKVQGMQHLQNPMITAEGENLLPPFYEWILNPNAKPKGPYELELLSNSTFYQISYFNVPCLPNTVYTISYEGSEASRIVVRNMDTNLGIISSPISYSAAKSHTFKTDTTARFIRVEFTASSGGTFTFKNPILTLGATIKTFVPRNPSYLYANIKLGAIGTAKDRLYKDGQDWKLRKEVEKDIPLDGNLSWLFSGDFIGTKNVYISLPNSPLNTTSIVTKYDGKLLKNAGSVALSNPDDQGTYMENSRQYIMISDTDTGFNETYTPTADEIKAFFNGWRVKTADVNSKPTAWKSILDGTDAPTQTLAYVTANKAPNYTPYKLSYALATPVIETVTDKVEGDISVNGLTQVEVSSGVIVREKVTPAYNASSKLYYINDINYGGPGTALKQRTAAILAIYRNRIRDTAFSVVTGGNNGLFRGAIAEASYDPTAEYTVTYLSYNREKLTANAVNVLAAYANNIRTALDDTVKRVEDNATNVSINSMLLYDVIKRLKAGGL